VTVDNDARALEALGAAIQRATSVLNSVGELYAAHDEKFHGGNAFAAHAVTTAHDFLLEAAAALSDLQTTHMARAEAIIEAEMAATEREASLANAAPVTSVLVPVASGEQLSLTAEDEEDVESILFWQGHSEDKMVGRTQSARAALRPGEEFAESYDELLRKVTAFEVFAQQEGQQQAAPSHQELMPLVRNFREGLLKFAKRSA
jgi:hypothetical protein